MTTDFMYKVASYIRSSIGKKCHFNPEPIIEKQNERPISDTDAIAENIRILSQLQGLSASIEAGLPVAADGSPIPWYTYPAIEFFSQLDASGLLVFEYGCGNSSLFWARKGARIWAVEHDRQWHKAMNTRSSTLQSLMLRETKESYAAAVHEPGEFFDLIIIDGIWRNECATAAFNRLQPHGLIILDNSDWYLDVAKFLQKKGFFQIDFNGFGPINPYCWTTSLFLPWQSSFQIRFDSPRPIGGISVSRGELW